MRHAAVLIAAMSIAGPAFAQDPDVGELRRQLAEQRERIGKMEKQLAEQTARLRQLLAEKTDAVVKDKPASATVARAVPHSAYPALLPSRLNVSGDLRVREEFNLSGKEARNRARSVLRARLRASYAVTPSLGVGAMLATGDPDDPNTTDVTIGNFVDDLSVSLDQAWIRYTSGGFTAYAGKFPQILTRTDMVWDGDVSPQGAGTTYSRRVGPAKIDARALYLVIDEAADGRDSDMVGGQLVGTGELTPALSLSLAGGYYHYLLGSVVSADAGDFRSNLITGGRYLSDFRLVDAMATLGWRGPSPRWPVYFALNYVRNLGAAVPADSGFNAEVAIGRAAVPGDWRLAYNYSEVEVDAVFAAFSHDNLSLATNYRLHGVGLSYVPIEDVLLDAAFYHYRPLEALSAGANQPRDWLDRVRLNLTVSF